MKLLKEILIGIPIALIVMIVTYTFLYQIDEEFKISQSSKGKGGIHYCHSEKQFFCKSETDRYKCCTQSEFVNQYWGEFVALPKKNGPDFLIIIIMSIGSAVIFNLAIEHYNNRT